MENGAPGSRPNSADSYINPKISIPSVKPLDLPIMIEDREDAEQIAGLPRLVRNVPDFMPLWRNILPKTDKISLQTYSDICKMDETVKAGTGFIATSIAKMLGKFVHKKDYIQKAIRSDIKGMKNSWNKAIKGLGSSGIKYGVGLLEADYRLGSDGLVHLFGLPQINTRTIVFTIDREPESQTNGEVQEIIQYVNSVNERRIPAAKVVRFTHDEEDGDPWGNSRYKAFYKDYVIKLSMLKAWALTLERCGTPLLWAKTKNAQEKVILSGETMTRVEYLTKVLTDIQNITGFVIEGEDEMNVIQANRSVGDDFEKIQNHENRMIMRALNIPSLIWETSNVGSFALGKKQFEMHLDFMADLMSEIVPELIKVIKIVIIANWGVQDDYGDFELNQFQIEDMEQLAKVYFAMSQEAYISPRVRKDMDKIRSIFLMDPLTDAEFNAMVEQLDKEQAAANPDPMQQQLPKTPGQSESPQPVGPNQVSPRAPNPDRGAKPKSPSKGSSPKTPFPKVGRAPKTPGAQDGRPPAV